MAASTGGFLEGLFGNDSTLMQLVLWNGFGQIIGTAIGPFLQALANEVNAAHPEVPISPADLADMVVRSIKSEADAATEAAMSGINADRFAQLVLANGEPPGLETVLEMARRGYVPWSDGGPGVPSVPEAVRTSRIRNIWLESIIAMADVPLTVADAVNAAVRNQIPIDQAKTEAYASGINAERFQILYDTTGRPPAPMELAEFVRRGLIPLHGTGPTALSFQQGIIEGDLKDKWEPVFEALVEHIPGLYDIRRMQSTGAITAAQAFSLYKQNGVSDDLAHALVAAGAATKLAGPKKLAESQVLKLYEERLITAADATADLESLNYDAAEAAILITIADHARAASALSSAVTNVRTRFLARKIGKDEAVAELAALGVPADQVTEIVAIWVIEWQGQHKVLTPAEIVDAVYYGISSQDWAIGKLTDLGYDAGDAWVLISIRLHGPQGSPPAGAPETPPPPPATAPAAPATGG